MRFKEFRILSEGTKGKQADVAKFDSPGYFTVGDSHSNGVGNYGRGKTWQAMGMDGASAFDPMHMSAIERIPAGSVVAISLGANDLGSKPIPQIVNQVERVISAAKGKGLNVVYLLPTATNNPENKAKRDELRNALSGAISVPTYDLGKVTGGDGLHQPMGVYSGIASKITSERQPKGSGVTLGPADAKPGAPASKDKDGDPSKAVGDKSNPYFNEKVLALQKELKAAGADLGSYGPNKDGLDGVMGPKTRRAAAAFPDIAAKHKETLNISNAGAANIDVKTIQDPDFNGKLDKVAKELGVKKEALIAIMKHESGVNPKAVNPMSGATGLIQFMPDTARKLGTSTDELRKMDGVEQLDYVYKYFKMVGVRPGMDLGDLYMAVFMPAHIGKPEDTVLGQSGASGFSGAVYRQNRGMDRNNDGVITIADVKTSVQRFA